MSADRIPTTRSIGENLDIHGIGDMPGHLIRRLHQVAVAHFGEATGSSLTPVQFAILTATARFSGVDQRTLANLVAFDRSTIGDVVQRLETRQLLRREASDTDRRSKLVFLTETGQSLLSEMYPLVERSQREFLAPLSEGEQDIFMYLIRKLAALSNDFSPAPLRDIA